MSTKVGVTWCASQANVKRIRRPPSAPRSTSPVSDERSVTEQIPCPALVLGLFAWRSGVKLGPLERVRSQGAHIPESNEEEVR